jgi:hypothetical protein
MIFLEYDIWDANVTTMPVFHWNYSALTNFVLSPEGKSEFFFFLILSLAIRITQIL